MEILLCSENKEIRQRWESLLGSAGYTFAHAGSVEELKNYLQKNNPEITLLHRYMVNSETVYGLSSIIESAKTFLLSDRPSDDEGLAFIKLGVVGYANTYISGPRLNEAVKVVLSGSVWLGQKLLQRLIIETVIGQEEKQNSENIQALANLTNREKEIAQLISKGKSNAEIAEELNIAERTVKTHLSSVYAKTNTNSRLNLALLINRGE